jgi:hypothetical protein
MRRLPLLLLIACAAAQPAIGSPLVASALGAGIRASDHAHSVELRSDGDHVDIVLSHGERSLHDHLAPCGPEHPADLTEADHVLHVTFGDAASATPRRLLQAHAPALTVAAALPVAAARPAAPVRSANAHARGPDHLRTVVLRL